MKAYEFLEKLYSKDRVIIRDFMENSIIADDIVKNLLDNSKYEQNLLTFEVCCIGIEDGAFLIVVFLKR